MPEPTVPPVAVQDQPDRHRYAIERDGQAAILTYRRQPGTIELIHTEVPAPLQGRGLAEALARHALEAARRDGVRVIPTCPFVQAYLRRHPDDRSLVE